MALNWRNPKWREDGRIDVEIEHPEHGWIPYTADPDDRHDILLRGGGNRPLHAEIRSSGTQIAPADTEASAPAPQSAPKLALIRAMRLLQLTGEPVTDPASQTTIWQATQGVLAAAPAALQEDWAAVTQVARRDPAMQMMIPQMPWPDGTDQDAVIDDVYRLAGAVDRGEIDPYTGQPPA